MWPGEWSKVVGFCQGSHDRSHWYTLSVDNNHHVAGKYMCVGFLCQGFLRRNKKQAIGVLVYMQAYIRTV
jgi:hypothetical protein